MEISKPEVLEGPQRQDVQHWQKVPAPLPARFVSVVQLHSVFWLVTAGMLM